MPSLAWAHATATVYPSICYFAWNLSRHNITPIKPNLLQGERGTFDVPLSLGQTLKLSWEDAWTKGTITYRSNKSNASLSSYDEVLMSSEEEYPFTVNAWSADKYQLS